MSNTGTAISAYRAERGLTLSAAAAAIGCSISFLSEVERGKRRLSWKRAAEVERVTGIPREVLRPDIFGTAPNLPQDAPQ